MSEKLSGMETKHFIIAGAQRSGTTLLAEILSRHSQIEMALPLAPEPKYFLPGKKSACAHAEYLAFFFKNRGSRFILGEKTVSYFETPGAAELIHACLPDSKIIFVLRDPVVRAVSNYYFSKAHGFEKRSLEEAFASLEDLLPGSESAGLSASPYAYLTRGQYSKMLKPFMETFGRQNMFILVQEHWVANDLPLKDLLTFLGAAPAEEMQIKKEVYWKSSSETGEIPLTLKTRLSKYYEVWNRALAEQYALEIDLWTRGI